MGANYTNVRRPLCHGTVPDDAGHWCRCGRATDSRWYDAHGDWCAVGGDDAWIGTLERYRNH